MNIIRYAPTLAGSVLLILAAGIPCPGRGGIGEQSFPVLQTKTASYTNVTVTTKGEDYIFIQHATGISSIKLIELSPELRQELGYSAGAGSKSKSQKERIVSVAAREFEQANKNLKPIGTLLEQKWSPDKMQAKVSPGLLIGVLAILLLVYIFFCYCCHLICYKVGSPNSPLVWLPGLQMIPLLRAAGMSGWWFLAMFVPLLSLIPFVLWSINIVKARGKHIIWAILLMLPFTSLVAFLYLAFSSSAPPEVPSASKFQARALQVA